MSNRNSLDSNFQLTEPIIPLQDVQQQQETHQMENQSSSKRKSIFGQISSFGKKLKQQIKTTVKRTDTDFIKKDIYKSFSKLRNGHSPSSSSFEKLIQDTVSISS